ncbi:MAG: hypothetical protein ABW151_12165, partial [Pseudorhodoplanes sp.]
MSDAAARVADATANNWVDRVAPLWSRPYLRLSRFDRPIGSWLLLMPCWWSAALASGAAHDLHQLPKMIALFFIGAFVMRGARGQCRRPPAWHQQQPRADRTIE